MRFRASGVSRDWIDVRFSEFVSDPLKAVEGIYEAAGIELSGEARAGMAMWVRENPRKDLQRARPADLAPYGIDPDEARSAFAEYCDTFDVAFDGI